MTLRTSNPVFYHILPPLTTDTTGWSAEIYDVVNPNTRLAIVPNWLDLSFSKPISDIGAGELAIDLDDPVFDSELNPVAGLFREYLLTQENLIRIYWDGQLVFTFLAEDTDENHIHEDGTRAVKVSGRGVGAILEWATVLPPLYPLYTGLVHTWTNTASMSAWQDLLEEAQARGTATQITPGFDHTTDSQGQPWPDSLNLQINPGSDLLNLLPRFAQACECEWIIEPSGVVKMGDAIGFHREGTVRFYATRHQTQVDAKRTRRSLRNVVFTESADHRVPQALDAVSVSAWDRREAYLPTANASDEGTAQSFANSVVKVNRDEEISVTFKIAEFGELGRKAFVDYDTGDYIGIDSDDTEIAGTYRVMAMSVKVDSDKKPDLELTTQSLFQQRLINLQKQFERLSGQNQWVDSALQVGLSGGGAGGTAVSHFSISDVDLGTIAPSGEFTWGTLIGVNPEALVWRFKLHNTGSLNWAVQVWSQPMGAGELMFEAIGIGDTDYQCSWPWRFQNQQSPAANEMYIGIRNIDGPTSTFTLVDMRGDGYAA